MATRAQVLSQLEALDTPTLQKLLTYSNQILIPDSDLLTFANMPAMITEAHTLADTYFPTWTDRTKDDFGEFLLELFALFSEKDFWYENAFANEGFDSRSVVYANVYYRAIMRGYYPVISSAWQITYQVTFGGGAGTGSGTLIPAGGIILNGGNNITVPLVNVTPVQLPVFATNYTVSLTFYAGIWQTQTDSYNGVSVSLRYSAIDITTVTQTINGVVWQNVKSFAKFGNSDKVFMVLPDTNGNATVIYGNNGYGIQPNVGDAIVTSFLYGTGSNIGFDVVTGTSTTFSAITSPGGCLPASATYAALGPVTGTDAESISSIKYSAEIFYRTRGSIMNQYDAITVIGTNPLLKQVQVIMFANNLYLYAIPIAGGPASQAYMTALAGKYQNYVGGQQGQVGYGLILSGFTTTYVPITVVGTAYFLQGFDLTAGQAAVAQFLLDYTNPLVNAAYGESFILSDFVKELVAEIEGVTNFVFDASMGVNGAVPANVILTSTQILQITGSSNTITATYA